jgi:hypothetical protein
MRRFPFPSLALTLTCAPGRRSGSSPVLRATTPADPSRSPQPSGAAAGRPTLIVKQPDPR